MNSWVISCKFGNMRLHLFAVAFIPCMTAFVFHASPNLFNGRPIPFSSIKMVGDAQPTVKKYILSEIGESVCADFVSVAQSAISSKGAFHVAIPGGSVLKMLSGLTKYKNSLDWKRVNLFYVNHKCVPLDDSSSTHFKAKGLFLDSINGINAFPVSTSQGTDASTIAALYAESVEKTVPVGPAGVPVFDYMLIGMGKDGHIGSLYPGRGEVLRRDAIVMSVDKKQPASVTLSLPVMNAASNIRVVCTGADKAEAVLCGLTKAKSASDFPVCGVAGDSRTTWMVDNEAAAHI